MTWRVVHSNRARRDLQKLDPAIVKRVLQALNRLATTQHGDVRRVRGRAKTWRLRVGEWRVMFTYEVEERTLRVIAVRHRSQAYR